MTQFEHENDLGRGGEVDDAMRDAWGNREERRGRDNDPPEAARAPDVDEGFEPRS